MSDDTRPESLGDDAVEGGNYDVIRERLTAQGQQLRKVADTLNAQRQQTFGSTELQILGNERVRTENNCVPRDIVQVGGHLLFGYNVFLGLKKQTTPDDVVSLHTFERTDAGFAFHGAPDDAVRFLADPTFHREFDELYQYYKSARLIQLRVHTSKLLAVFQTGATTSDVKVLRWALDANGGVTYLDNRGERDHTFPPTHDFEWLPTSRSDHILGRHPHVNIADEVFVETVGGDLTVKVEDNTEDGQGIFREPVDDPNQSLDDADIRYARRGQQVLIQVTPYGETTTRYLVFNIATRTVQRIDAIGISCVALPEDHGIVFPGGYALRTGDTKVFDERVEGLRFVRAIHAPNGEDVLYVFHRADDGLYALYPYNLIRKEVATPITAHGYSLMDDGTLVVFRADDEPTRVHPMQIWSTPFVSAETHSDAPTDGSLLGRIGNKDLVRGISDALTLVRLVNNTQPTRQMYEELVSACNRFVDAYYWISEAEVGDLRSVVEGLRRTAERIIDEFEKVQVLRQRAKSVVREARTAHDQLMIDVRAEHFERVDQFLAAMTQLRAHRGHLITLKEVRYVDIEALDTLENQSVERFDRVSRDTVTYLLGEGAFAPLAADLDALLADVEQTEKAIELAPLTERLDTVTTGVNLLGEVVSGLTVEDPTDKTRILEGISEVVSHANRARAVMDVRRQRLNTSEGTAEFVAQFRLFGQSVASALALCDTPDACDDHLSRMLLQLEELEARFGDFDAFLPKLTDKREEVYEAFTARKQTLLDARQRRVGALLAAADRILTGVQRRAASFKTEDELNSWFAADPMVLKLRSLTQELEGLGDTVKSDEMLSRLTAAKQDALRGLRDTLELFADGTDLLKLGKHQFTVNTQPLELTLVPHSDGELAVHLTGTDFREPITDPDFRKTKPHWDQSLVSEDATVYRGEYLAAELLTEAEAGRGVTLAELEAEVLDPSALLNRVRRFSSERYDEGYDRGIHDSDAAKILAALVTLRTTAGLLRFPSGARALAALFWAFAPDRPADAWTARARSLARLRDLLGPSSQLRDFCDHLSVQITTWATATGFDAGGAWSNADAPAAGEYLFEVLARDPQRFVVSQDAATLRQALDRWLEDHGGQMTFEDALRPLGERWPERFDVKCAWLRTLSERSGEPSIAALADLDVEAAAWMITERRLDVDVAGGSGQQRVDDLLGQHPRLQDGGVSLQLSEFLDRLGRFRRETVPGYRDYRARRSELLVSERRRLRIDEYTPRVMTSFVRNKLINDVYLPLVGDNLAKQLGAAGRAKRTDLMGLLLLVSPPGYGKTTLMEYVASRVGLTFVKVNGPALGHNVTSLDPAEAPNATARQEVDKVNLALEMGNNVMLYLDDIQHCHPEFLQKFISLCDAQRRIEGVWNGRTRTYDLRGKKFCVVMAGNPYTESGDKFQIPDMLANRADTYNLGDILGSTEAAFALSFVENALTSNPALAPLASRSQSDVYALVRRAQGEQVPTTELSHDYSAVELSEIESVLQHLFRAQAVLLAVNAEYIRSAATEDAYRTEPRFQLQGSYRNMNKIAEKIVPAMNEAEVEQLVSDHYQSEAQTLTDGAESNLLKLAEMRGCLTDAQSERWTAIREEFARRQLIGGDDDPATRVASVLATMSSQLGKVGESLDAAQQSQPLQSVTLSLDRISKVLQPRPQQDLAPVLEGIQASLDAATHAATAAVQQPVPIDLAPMLLELRAIREALGQVPTAPSNGHAPRPGVDLAVARHQLLRQASAALGDGSGRVDANGNATLAAALSVIETLTVHMATAARDRLPPGEHAEFVDDLKRTVASAVTDLAGPAADRGAAG